MIHRPAGAAPRSSPGRTLATLTLFSAAIAPAFAPAAAQELFPGRHWPLTITGDQGLIDPVAILALDLDEDGAQDVVTANAGADSVSFLRGDGHGGFLPPVVTGVGDKPLSLASGDVNGDGHADLVSAQFDSDDVTVLLGDGAGGLARGASYSVSEDPRWVILADLDGDGALDIVTANDRTDTVAVLRGDGFGSFAPPQYWPTGDTPYCVVAANLDADGHLDLATANNVFPGTLSVLRSNGSGGFLPTVTFQADAIQHFGPQFVTATDWNGDGHLDLLSASAASGSPVSIHFGDGNGAFGPALGFSLAGAGGAAPRVVATDLTLDGVLDLLSPSAHVLLPGAAVAAGDGAGGLLTPASVPGGNPAVALALADFDGDGLLDAALAHDATGEVSVLRGNGSALFAQPPSWPVPGLPATLASADLDGDGHLDALTLNPGPVGGHGDVVVLRGDGIGGLLPFTSRPVGARPTQLATGDFDEDGALDVVVANFSGVTGDPGSVSLLRGDGAGALLPATNFSAGTFPETLAVGDVNGDGHLDVVAGNTLLTPWGLTVLLGDGHGALGPAQTTVTSVLPRPLLLRDLNGDGYADLFLASSLRLNDGAGHFLADQFLPVGFEVVGLTFADVNEDGKGDLVVGGTIFFKVFAGDGAGHFAHPFFDLNLALGGQIAVADFDGDGHVDLAGTYTPNSYTPALRVVHGDGAGTFHEPITYTAGFLTRTPQAIDLDSDGRMDLLLPNDYLEGKLFALLNRPQGSWTDVGSALAGVHGPPQLVGISSLLPGAPIALHVLHGPSFGSAALVLGGALLDAPFKGGVMVPLPSLILFGLPLDASGHFAGSGTWFGGLPPGTSTWFQAWMPDAAAPAGYSATNGLRANTPN